MAYFESWVAADTTGQSTFYQWAVATWADFELIQIAYADYYTDFWGSFTYDIFGNPYGDVDAIDTYNYVGADTIGVPFIGGQLLQTWEADFGTIYPAETLAYLMQFGTGKELMEFLFFLDDELYGSVYNDKLAGWNGADFLDGFKGNDMLWGGPGPDTFYFGKKYKKDTIKDLERKKDTIVIEKSLAKNFKKLKKAAEKYKDGVKLDFGKDELKIENIKMKHLKKIDFDFVA